MSEPGQVIILNGAPRSGKSSIAAVIQSTFPGDWLALGVDAWMANTPAELRPGIGLRPGGERPDLEPYVVDSYLALYRSIAAHARAGFNVVVDVGHHDDYSRPLGILPRCRELLEGIPVLFVGVHCPIETIMARRNAGQPGRERQYVVATPADPVPAPILRWQTAVHANHAYDLELDTSLQPPTQCAEAISSHLAADRP